MYTVCMDVTITQFRRDLFNLVEQAMNGVEVHVMHKGKGFTVKPDEAPQGRLSRIKPLKIVRGSLDGASEQLYEEMKTEWGKDWAEL